MVSRLHGFSPDGFSNRLGIDETHPDLQPWSGNGTEIADDLEFVAEAIRTDVDFEPFESVGDVRALYNAAVNLFKYVEAYEDRTGSLKLPD